MTRLIISITLMTLCAVGCGSDSDDEKTDQGAFGLIEDVYGYFEKGQFTRAYDALYAPIQVVVDRDLYDRCMGDATDNITSAKFDVTLDETYDDTVEVLGKQTDVIAVTIELTVTIGNESDTGSDSHNVVNNGDSTYSWILEPDAIAAYEAGDCPGVNGESEQAIDATTPKGDQEGTRDNPIPLGQTVTVGDWDIEVLGSEAPAEATIMASNEFLPGPDDGETWATVSIKATYNGEDAKAQLALGPSFHLVGATNKELDAYGCTPMTDRVLASTDDVFQAGSIEGDLCFSGTPADLEGLVMYVDEPLNFENDDIVFMAIS